MSASKGTTEVVGQGQIDAIDPEETLAARGHAGSCAFPYTKEHHDWDGEGHNCEASERRPQRLPRDGRRLVSIRRPRSI